MLIVDAQVHIWSSGKPTNANHRQVAAFTKDDLLKEMDEAGVDAAVIHPPASWDPNSNELAVEAARQHPNRLAILGNFPLDKPDMLIGRSSQASGYTADIDLSGHDPDKTLSRKHARVTRSNDGVFLKEEEGRNGTFVNGTRVGPGQTVRLEEGDRIRFGLVEVVFRSA